MRWTARAYARRSGWLGQVPPSTRGLRRRFPWFLRAAVAVRRLHVRRCLPMTAVGLSVRWWYYCSTAPGYTVHATRPAQAR